MQINIQAATNERRRQRRRRLLHLCEGDRHAALKGLHDHPLLLRQKLTQQPAQNHLAYRTNRTALHAILHRPAHELGHAHTVTTRRLHKTTMRLLRQPHLKPRSHVRQTYSGLYGKRPDRSTCGGTQVRPLRKRSLASAAGGTRLRLRAAHRSAGGARWPGWPGCWAAAAAALSQCWSQRPVAPCAQQPSLCAHSSQQAQRPKRTRFLAQPCGFARHPRARVSLGVSAATLLPPAQNMPVSRGFCVSRYSSSCGSSGSWRRMFG